MASSDLFEDDWFDKPSAGAPDVAPADPDAGPLLDLRRGMAPADIAAAGAALEDRLRRDLDAGYRAMLAQVKAGLLADRTPNPSDAQPVITRLADTRDLCLRVGQAWTAAGKHAEALAGDLVTEEVGDDRVVVADGHGAEIVVSHRSTAEHAVDDETVLGVARAQAALRAQQMADDIAQRLGTAAGTTYGDSFLTGAEWALDLLNRLAKPGWRRTELDVLARELEEANQPELAATLRRAVSTKPGEARTKMERRPPSKGRGGRGSA